jgi:cbb3-type cytochrome oxidase cytochrome c subunit
MRVIVVLGVLLGTAVPSLQAQQAPHAGHGTQGKPQSSAGHDAHQTPEGWKFTWPQGDSVKGRDLFIKLECYSCHEVQGQTFPAPGGTIGPELSAMGPLHDPEYFAEAIINPSAVIEPGKAYEAADDTSKMPSYNDLVTVQEVIDLVTYLKGLRPPVSTPARPGRANDAGGGHDGH